MNFIKSKTFITIIISVISTLLLSFAFLYHKDSHLEDDYLSELCNVLIIPIRGDLKTYFGPDSYDENGHLMVDGTSSEDILAFLEDLENYPNIKAILTIADSFGGEIVAGKEINDYFKQSHIPVVALIRSAADSAAYYAISGSKMIFASELSSVGSIGVTQSILSNAKKNEKEGLTFIEVNSGKFKDTFNPDKPVTQEEIAYVKGQINTAYNKFVRDISYDRNIPLDKVFALADGSSVLGEKAKEIGLIDEIGNYYDAVVHIEQLIGENVYVCKY